MTASVGDPGGLGALRVLDFSTQIAGPYCTKLLADAGAHVIKVEPPGGDGLRGWSASGADLAGRDSGLFAFLNAGKESVVGTAADAHVAGLIAHADLVVHAYGLAYENGERLDPDRLRAEHPALVVVSITPYGTTGPWADRQATEFTIQAECASIGQRGVMGKVPFQAGGRIGEWAAGAYAAAAALPAVLRARATGVGEHVDLSILETANLIYANYSETMNRLMHGSPADPEFAFLAPTIETPSIERTADGYVGFTTNARQQFDDFLVLIERPDLLGDEELAQVAGRVLRFEEWGAIVSAWCAGKTTAEIIERASLLRIPVSPVGNGCTVLEHEQLVARGVFVPDAGGRFLQPRRPYRIDDADPPAPRPAPRLDPHARPEFPDRPPGPEPLPWTGADRSALPLAGLRILDVTAWWAGPAASGMLAALGATVVHVESPSRPDGMRMIGGMHAAHYDRWWEASPHFLHANANKLGVTLDLEQPDGIALLERLVEWCDAVVENFTPRVFDNFGLTWERIRARNPHAILLRMPAFGLTGPWRDRPGFAQTVEQLSGLAWVTGDPDDQPRIPRGPCDPVAGMHAVVALMVALAERRRSGRGHHVEVTLAEVALNLAAEQVVEWTAYGNLLEREGNRSPLAAPQGLYPCAPGASGTPEWLALSVVTDDHWQALRAVMGDPEWAAAPALAARAGRRAQHDLIDEHLRAWTRTKERAALEGELRAAGVLASAVADPSRLLQTNPQLRARGYFEAPDHEVLGPMPLPSLPLRFSTVDRWLRTPAPLFGEHNHAVLGGILGLPAQEIAALEDRGVTGVRFGPGSH